MKTNYKIKEMDQTDFDGSAGFLETLANLSEVGDITLTEAKKIISKINSQGGHVYIAVNKDGQIIGATTIIIEQKFIHHGGKVGHIEDVVTREGYERIGVGKALMEKALETAKMSGCYKVILDCSEDLITFYEKLGFRVHANCMRLDL
jgi:glucosamine-phosphate N-acetyltransferase